MTKDEEIRRANEAKRIIEDPLVIEALAAMRGDLIAEWEKAPARDTEGRERLWAMVKTIDKFRSFFVGAMEGGKVAQAQLLRVGQI